MASMEEMTELVVAAAEALKKVALWRRNVTAEESPEGRQHKLRVFAGAAAGWRFVLTDFAIEDQGFPPGSRGYDGVGCYDAKNTMLHLPRDLARAGLNYALGATGGN